MLYHDSLFRDTLFPLYQEIFDAETSYVTTPRGYKEYLCINLPQNFWLVHKREDEKGIWFIKAHARGDSLFYEDSLYSLTQWRNANRRPCICIDGAQTYSQYGIEWEFPNSGVVTITTPYFDTVVTLKEQRDVRLEALPLSDDKNFTVQFNDTVVRFNDKNLRDDWMEWHEIKERGVVLSEQ